MKFKHSIAILVVIALVAGALGGILFDSLIIPKLSFLPGFGWLRNYASNAPIVITRNEQVVLNEGVNLIELAQQTSSKTVSIYRGTKPQSIFAGVGTIMTSDGLIFTTKSVVGNQQEVTVVTNDGINHTGLVRALDPKTDLAVVTISARNLAVAEFGSSLELRAGQRVVAVGVSNKEYERRLSSGNVTNSVMNNKSLDQVFDSERLADSFGTNLALDGNFTGAPVVNLNGKLVALVANSQGSLITSENLKPALDSYLQTGKITRSRLGIQYWSLTDLQASLRNLTKAGVLVLAVDATSPAAKALLQANDLIFEVDGDSLRDRSFEQLLNQRREGPMKVKLLRAGKELELTINLEPTK